MCSDIEALAEVAGGAAVLVPALDVERWADAIGEVAADDERRRSLTRAGYQRAGHFSWMKTAGETHAIYEELVGVDR